MNLKIKVSQASGICSLKSVPYLIVGASEFQDVSPTIKLTIVDGVIGALLTSRTCQEHFSKGFQAEFVGMTQEQFNELSENEKSEAIGDWVMANEIAFEAEHCPVFKANGRLLSMMRERGIYETCTSTSIECDPPLPDNLTPRERAALIDKAHRIGVTYTYSYLLVKPGQRLTIRHPGRPRGELSISRTVWLPNLYTLGVPILNLGSEIGRMLCQMELKGRYPVVMAEATAPL